MGETCVPLDSLEQSKISALPFPEQASGYSPLRSRRRCLLPDRTVGNWSRSAAYILRPPVLPGPCLSCTDFQILLLVWGSLVIRPQQWGIFRFLPRQKIWNSSPSLSNIQSSVKPKRSVQLQTLPKLYLCLLYMKCDRSEDLLERCWENRMSLHKLWERFHFG